MGKRTSLVFRLGIIIIVLFFAHPQILLLLYGKEADGKVIDLKKSYGVRGRYGRRVHNYPVVEFKTADNQTRVCMMSEDINTEVDRGNKVKVLYLTFYPYSVKIKSLLSFLDGSLAVMGIVLLVWT